jgi:glycosyltransferase involved in cell wall biosynthesis
MRIAFILPSLSNKGPIIVAKDIIDNISNEHEIDLYYFDDINEIYINCNLIKISIFDKIDFDKYDVVHSHMLRPDFYVWFHKKKHKNTLFVSTLHQNIYDNLKGNYNFVTAFIFEKIWLYFLLKQDIVVTLTNVMKNFYLKKSNLNMKTIYNGRNVNFSLIHKNSHSDNVFFEQVKKNYKVIGTHCLLTKRKGIDQIIKSLKDLEDYALVIIGDGKEMVELKKLSKELNISDRCFFLGYRSDAISLISFFDVYVMSSYSEGFPLGLLEAGLCKLPIVCSDIPIFRELFEDGTVSFFELDNTSSLTNSIRKCYENREDFAIKIFEVINEKYSLECMASNYSKIYSLKK